jgi:hypothetical protein
VLFRWYVGGATEYTLPSRAMTVKVSAASGALTEPMVGQTSASV